MIVVFIRQTSNNPCCNNQRQLHTCGVRSSRDLERLWSWSICFSATRRARRDCFGAPDVVSFFFQEFQVRSIERTTHQSTCWMDYMRALRDPAVGVGRGSYRKWCWGCCGCSVQSRVHCLTWKMDSWMQGAAKALSEMPPVPRGFGGEFFIRKTCRNVNAKSTVKQTFIWL